MAATAAKEPPAEAANRSTAAKNGLREGQKADYGPAILTTARTANRQRTSNVALTIRMSCVFGSTSRHTKATVTATSDRRNANNRILLNIGPRYPIFASKSRQKSPHLTYLLGGRCNKRAGRQFTVFGVVSVLRSGAVC